MFEIGDRIPIARETGDAKLYVVVGHDVAENAEVIPDEASHTIEDLTRYIGPTKARQIAQRVLVAAELGV